MPASSSSSIRIGSRRPHFSLRAHVAAGNPARAVAAYEQLRATLEKELGTRPSAEAEAVLHQALEK